MVKNQFPFSNFHYHFPFSNNQFLFSEIQSFDIRISNLLKSVILVIGLGNPGLKYKKTRHNIGFMALDLFQKENNFPKFKVQKKFLAEVSEGVIDGQKIVLVKPQTYMNKSGISVNKLLDNCHCEERSDEAIPSYNNAKIKYSDNLIIIHDDFDLALGKIKTTEASGSAGHHGVESIIKALGTNNFKRVRVGIRPADNPQGVVNLRAEDFILKKFSKEEQEIMNQALSKANEAVKTIFSDDVKNQ